MPFSSHALACARLTEGDLLSHDLFVRTLAGYRPKTIKIPNLRFKYKQTMTYCEVTKPSERIRTTFWNLNGFGPVAHERPHKPDTGVCEVSTHPT